MTSNCSNNSAITVFFCVSLFQDGTVSMAMFFVRLSIPLHALFYFSNALIDLGSVFDNILYILHVCIVKPDHIIITASAPR